MIWEFLWNVILVSAAFFGGVVWSRTGRKKEERKQERSPRIFYSVGSPVSGRLEETYGEEHPTVTISPFEDKLYAPTGGKITRLFPMGNEFLFQTEFGAELHIRVGDPKDDLQGRYYRPRVVGNEIVSKGKLLLEFDRKALEAEGTSPHVSVSVTNRAYGSRVEMTAWETVKSGEEILQVQEQHDCDEIHRD